MQHGEWRTTPVAAGDQLGLVQALHFLIAITAVWTVAQILINGPGSAGARDHPTPPGGAGPPRNIPMNDPNTFATLAAAFIRHLLTLAGGFLVARGVITTDQGPELVGLGMAVAAFAWSFLQKHNANKILQNALNGFTR